ncbi:MAG TPA: hypothetical protein ENK18_11455 [Deltaproteobacteria bacterium]|nr:hypothetical protein [Deltaproteobacteria bacterium]
MSLLWLVGLWLVGLVLAEPAAGDAAPPELQAPEEPSDGGFAGIVAPLIAYDTNLLLGLGAFGQVVGAEPSGSRPFRFSVIAQIYATTGGYQDHSLQWDLPGIGGSPVRWSGRVRYLRWTRAGYYGLGNDTLLVDGGSEATLWESLRPNLSNTLRIRVGPGAWEVYGSGLIVAQGVEADPESRLSLDRPTGVGGGLLTALTLGLFHNTRDNEIDPTSGHTIDVALYGSAPVIASHYTYVGIHTAARAFHPLRPSLVAAGHALVEAATTGEPFFQQTRLDGLSLGTTGGRYLLRGLAEGRLQGNGVAALQGELRWTFARTLWFGSLELGWMLVPFADVGQVWTWDEPRIRLDPHLTGGSGLRINVEGLLVLRGDVGFALERYADEPLRRLQPQIYLLSEHPF